VSLNISATKNTRASSARRRRLCEQVTEELSSWNPREFIAAFRRWHHGALSLIHLNVLTLLEVEGPLSMSRLAEALDVSVASATGIVDRMEARGLVERRRESEDRRVVVVHIAEGGTKVFADIDERRRQGLAKLLTRLNERELSGLLAGHQALRAARTELANQRTGPAAGATEDEMPKPTATAREPRP
jgi:DNA-binding MarR family transcriptional regulator